jgi:hypothetical protein
MWNGIYVVFMFYQAQYSRVPGAFWLALSNKPLLFNTGRFPEVSINGGFELHQRIITVLDFF